MSCIIVKGDTEKNRLYITLSGKFDPENSFGISEILHDEIAKLKPGFTILNNSRDLTPGCNNIQRELFYILKQVIDSKPSKVARIASPLMNMVFTQIEFMLGMNARFFTSLVDAEKYLNGEITFPERVPLWEPNNINMFTHRPAMAK